MPLMGIDFAWTRPTAAEAKAAGAEWAAGYYSTDPTKNLTHGLVASYIAAGLPIVGVWETTTGRALAGFQAGANDARTAMEQRALVGLPVTAVIHFAVDTDTDWPSVEQYFAGASSVLGQHRVGVYGGIRVIAGAAAAGYTYLWQTVAWSNGQWDPHTTIHQEAGTLFGGNSDIDYSETADFGQYPQPLEDDMPYTPAQLVQYAQEGAAAALQAERTERQEDNVWWLAHALTGTMPPNASPAVVASITAIRAEVLKLEAEPAPVSAPKA